MEGFYFFRLTKVRNFAKTKITKAGILATHWQQCGLKPNRDSIPQVTYRSNRSWPVPMDRPHQQILSTYPVAVKYGQGRIHVRSPIPWHHKCEDLKCPQCGTSFSVTVGYPREDFLNQLDSDHRNNREHADCISSGPNRVKTADCDCGM